MRAILVMAVVMAVESDVSAICPTTVMKNYPQFSLRESALAINSLQKINTPLA